MTVSMSVNAESITNIEAKAPAIKWQGEALHSLPQDLYIPPDALEVVLEVFEGPLDLLLYLIKKHNLDILDIPVAEITRQYMDYIGLISGLRLNLAADYLEMAAFLAEIKSRMLLPRPETAEAEEEDPRAELVRRLQAYEQFKKAAEKLDTLPRKGRDVFAVGPELPAFDPIKHHPDVELKEILLALKEIFKRADLVASHTVRPETLSVREKMSHILSCLSPEGGLEPGGFVTFVSLFNVNEGRLGVVVTFLAMLELIRESLVTIVQTEVFGPIYLRIPDVQSNESNA